MLLYLAFGVEILFMLLFPVALGFYLVRRFGVRWGLFGFGALAFVGSQVIRLPLLYGATIAFQRGMLPSPPEGYAFAFNVVVMSLTAGLFEEGARYLVYRFLIKKVRTWREALAFGAGHGGIESILAGLAVVLTLVTMIVRRGMDLSQLPVSGEQAPLIAQQVEQFFALPWYTPLLGGVERLFAITLHISLAVLVLQVFTQGKISYLFMAMGYHGLANLIAVSINAKWGVVAAESVVLLVALFSLWIIRRYRPVKEASP